MVKPAVLGGKPAFEKMLPIIKPTTASTWETIQSRAKELFTSGQLSGNQKHIQKFELLLSKATGAKYNVAVSSCTSGLMLTLLALGISGSEVIMPSFTFSATAHAVTWAGCKPVFADIDDTFCLNPESVKAKITKKTGAILAVHMYGLPCNLEAFADISFEYFIPVVYDAAHAIGVTIHGAGIGQFGVANVYSFSPTKLITTLEGGAIATNNPELARRLYLDRNYSNLPNYQCERVGLSARMDEFRALVGIDQLSSLNTAIANRNACVKAFKNSLLVDDTPGILFQRIPEHYQSTHKDLSIVIVEQVFGLNREELGKALVKENIMTKRYFYPPIHELKPYKQYASDLSKTKFVSRRVLSLPIHNDMKPETAVKIAKTIHQIHLFAPEIRKALA